LPARFAGGRNSDCGFSPTPSGGSRQKNGCQDSSSLLMDLRFVDSRHGSGGYPAFREVISF
jgi:hypothetical protein